jgi:hypothetical protein
MRPLTPAGPLRQALAALIVVLPLLAIVGAGSPARSVVRTARPRPENPHGKFRGECDQCHGPEGWKPARISKKFDHGRFGFPLQGAHAAASCLGCHRSLDFSSSSMQCASCHEDPHRGEMGTDCARCHSARSFVDRGPMVRAHQLTRFPLSGSHAGLDCETCHPPAAQGRLRFVNTQAECRACHMDQYRSAKDPDHLTSGISTECQSCHAPTSWSRARFDHARSGFPLTGAHRAAACASCHPGGRYAGTPRDCISCHQQDYDTAQPPHAASGFATSACASCHTTTTWAGAVFDHDSRYFRIYRGGHAGRWSACSDCHQVPTDFSSFNCLGCHPHSDRAKTDGKHVGRSGYRYESTSCYSCHTR